MSRNLKAWPLALSLVGALAACADEPADDPTVEDSVARKQQVFPGPTEPITNCDPHGAFTTRVTNPYFPLTPRTRRLLEGEEDGVPASVRITVLDETQVIAGVRTRVVEEFHTAEGVVVEISRNYFAQAVGGGTPPGASSPRDGTVCYFGEDVDIFNEDGTVTHESAWRTGVDGALPGIVMPGRVAKGQAYLQEVATGVAEDRAWHTRLENGRLVVLEDTPLEPGAISKKVYKKGVGLVRDSGLELVSLEVLDDCDHRKHH